MRNGCHLRFSAALGWPCWRRTVRNFRPRAQRAGTHRGSSPALFDGIFPCTNCHAGMPVNRTRRELTAMHTDIVLKHDETHRWCLDCHDANNRDYLHLASGEPSAVRRILPHLRPVSR